MKKTLLIVISALLLVASMGMAQDITRIYDIQYTEAPSGDSPLVDQEVTIQGIVTGETYAYGSEFYVQDSVGAWSGIMVYVGSTPDSSEMVGQGDLVTVTGTIAEYYGMTELEATSVTVDSMWAGDIEPILVNSGDVATDGDSAEAYESVLVKVESAAITQDPNNYGEWLVDDGTGEVMIDDNADYYFWASEYDSVDYVIGPMNYSYSEHRIQPRMAADVKGTSEYTRVQMLQQVRGSDLARIGHVENDDTLDYSYFVNYDGGAEEPLPGAEPYTVHGIVTMPTGLSYAGDGVKFIMADPHGGPWSGILLYSPDSTAFPVLYEGDEISVSGYVGEYVTSPSNMTEFWISGEVNILSVGNEVPEEPHVNTGDLRWPTTAEQWGTAIVKLKDVIVTNNDYNYQEWGVDDGTGEVRIDDDSDSLSNFLRPPLGTAIDSITGWIYHHYGFYVDSTTYKLEPLYKEDIVIGEGPPTIRNYVREPGVPGPSDAVTVTAELSDNSAVTAANVYYSVNGGAYQTAQMSQSEGVTWSGDIPAQADGDWVDYFIKAEDDNSTMTTLPADTSVLQYSYRVKEELTITDVQYTPWENAQSPYEGARVGVSGVVTADTSFNSNFDAYVIQQDGATEWGGLFVFGLSDVLLEGQSVEVFGTVTDFNADWHFKWDNNTVLLADSLEAGTEGEPLSAMVMTTDELETNPEMYEGMFVRVNDVEVTAVNQYDWSITDASGGDILIDDDAMTNTDWFDSLEVGSQFGDVRGIWTYSFGTYKISLRDDSDHGTITGVNEDRVAQPYEYSLSQNYPNPFNPTTNIKFSLADQQPVTIAIYNVRGQLVNTLMQNQSLQPGSHVINWDGTDKAGNTVGSGVYIYRIQAGDFIKAKKMTLIR